MSIASEITRINTNISNAYTACNNKGATMPVTQNSENLATTISSISTGISTCITATYTVSTVQSNKNVTLISGNSFIASNYNNSKAFALVVRISGLQTNGLNIAANTNQQFGTISSNGDPVYGWYTSNAGTKSQTGYRLTSQLNTSPPSNLVGNINVNSDGDLIIRCASGDTVLQAGDYFIIFGLMQ